MGTLTPAQLDSWGRHVLVTAVGEDVTHGSPGIGLLELTEERRIARGEDSGWVDTRRGVDSEGVGIGGVVRLWEAAFDFSKVWSAEREGLGLGKVDCGDRQVRSDVRWTTRSTTEGWGQGRSGGPLVGARGRRPAVWRSVGLEVGAYHCRSLQSGEG
jgi:hypothetical protein